MKNFSDFEMKAFMSLAMDDAVNHAVIQQEFAALKPFWKFLAYRLFDNARPSKPNQGARLGDVEIAKHCEAGGHAACRGIGEHRYIRRRFLSRCARADEMFAICIKLRAPSCMRAPPEHEITTSAEFCAIDRSIARVISRRQRSPSSRQ